MRTCITCKLSLPVANFLGNRNQCRKCRNAAQKVSIEAMRLREKQQALMDLAKRDNPRENVALPRTFAYLNSTYKPERGYARNDGLKHIQSRGV